VPQFVIFLSFSIKNDLEWKVKKKVKINLKLLSSLSLSFFSVLKARHIKGETI
jgi:hypothetical protein